MIELKNTASEIQQFKRRVSAAVILILICFSLLFIRFFWLQVIRHDAYALKAEDNRISIVPIVPYRGLIMDRNGVILAQNYSAYTLEITPSKITMPMDQLIDQLREYVDITPRDIRRFKKLQTESKNFESIPLLMRLNDEEVAKLTAQRYRFPGVDIQARLFRQYPYGSATAHVIGYIGRISQKDQQNIEAAGESAEYNGSTYIGKEGLEKSYEKQLHGKTGYEEVEISASGRAVRTLSHVAAEPGKNLILSIDIKLQQIIEKIFGDRKGALVAIEPSTGDILAYVSQPSYDPNLFVEGIDQQNWNMLNNSPDRPLLNRPISGTYSPASTYKPYLALGALETGKRRPTDTISDPGYFMLGNHKFRDVNPNGNGIIDLHKAIQVSSDTYFYMLANDMGVDAIHDFASKFGFGSLTGIDLDHEKKGILPSTDWKRKSFKSPQMKRWIAGDTISLGIGQGYNSFTPMQIAQAVSILANNGVVMRPHLVKMIEDSQTHDMALTVPKESYRIPLKQSNVDLVKQAMIDVNRFGSGRRIFGNSPYPVAGKTGTGQVIGIKKNEKYDASRIAAHFRDNGLYIAFAPADHPKIALAVIVENGGFGASSAAPIAKKVLDYYLLGKTDDDKSVTVTQKPDAGEERERAVDEEQSSHPVENSNDDDDNNAEPDIIPD